MQGIEREIIEFCHLRDSKGYEVLINNLDEESKAKARAILDILEISEISVANAKLILHICEDTIERCTPVNTREHT